VKRYGESQLTLVGFASLVVGYFGLGLANTIVLLLVVSTISSFGHGVLRPALTSLITQHAGRHEQGVVLGLTQSMTSIASIIAPVVAGLLIERQQLFWWAGSAALMAAVGAVLAQDRRIPVPA
jgi:MFS family permease